MSVIIMILLLSVLILVHEAGHFLAAKAFKMKVSKFGFGLPIGPTLWEKQVGDVKVLVHAFLLGGYVGFPDDDPNSKIPLDDPDRIANRPAWQKFWVISAGVISNVIFAYIIVLFVAFSTGSLPSGNYEITVNSVQEGNVAAKDAGFEKGDKMLYVNGVKITNPMIFSEIAQRSKKFDGYVEESKVLVQIENIKEANKNIKFLDNTKIPTGVEIIIPKPLNEDYIKVEEDFYLRKRPTPSGLHLTEEQEKLRDIRQ